MNGSYYEQLQNEVPTHVTCLFDKSVPCINDLLINLVSIRYDILYHMFTDDVRKHMHY